MTGSLRWILLAGFFAALTGVSAWIRVPMVPVPFTLQTLFVLLSGSILGPYWGAASMILYLILGLVGLPVFAGGSGIAVVLSPTFGYLLGFPLASFWIGKRISAWKKFNFGFLWGEYLLGLIWVYAPGVAYLWLIKNLYTGEPFPVTAAIFTGFIILLPGALIKTFAATLIYKKLRSLLPAVLGFLIKNIDQKTNHE